MTPYARQDLPAMGSLDAESLMVAMAIAPGVYSRNRFFELFKAPEIRRARSRASLVRGIARHLAMLRDDGADVAAAVSFERRSGRVGCRYRVATLSFERSTELSELETACVLYLAERASLAGLSPTPVERDALRAALLRLSGGEAALLMR